MADPLEQLRSWTATAAAGVTSAAGLIASAGPADQPFAWASVTKLLVVLAKLDAAQCGWDGQSFIQHFACRTRRILARSMSAPLPPSVTAARVPPLPDEPPR